MSFTPSPESKKHFHAPKTGGQWYQFTFSIGFDNIAYFEQRCNNDEKAVEMLQDVYNMVIANEHTSNSVTGEVRRRYTYKILGRVGLD